MMKRTSRQSLALCALLAGCGSDPSPPAVDAGPPPPPPPEIGSGQEGVPVPPPVDAAPPPVDRQPADDAGGDDAGADDAGAADAPPPGPILSCADGPYFPFRAGNTWTYLVTENTGGRFVKMNRVIGPEPVPVEGPHFGKPALRAETYGRGVGPKAVSWQVVNGTRLIRYAELEYDNGGRLDVTQYWVPHRLRLDEDPSMLLVGLKYSETYMDHKQIPLRPNPETTQHTDVWTVEAVDEVVTVPRGTFKAVRLKKLLNSTSDERGKTYWFARCVGKIKERGVQGTGQHEDLVEFNVQLP